MQSRRSERAAVLTRSFMRAATHAAEEWRPCEVRVKRSGAAGRHDTVAGRSLPDDPKSRLD